MSTTTLPALTSLLDERQRKLFEEVDSPAKTELKESLGVVGSIDDLSKSVTELQGCFEKLVSAEKARQETQEAVKN